MTAQTRARELAAALLGPAAARVEAEGAVPGAHLDALAAAGLFAVAGDDVPAVIEELAAGDLATAFVWVQHLGVARQLAAAVGAGAAQWAGPLADLRAGRLRAGVALQAALRPGPPAVTARRDGDELVLDGAVPWVTGWGLVDALLLTARDGDDVRFLLLDVAGSGGPGGAGGVAASLRAEPQPLVAVRASSTVELHLRGHRVPVAREVLRAPHAALLAGDAAGLRPNGSLALGLVLRCTRELGPTPLDDALAAARERLDAASPDALPGARAGAAALAWRAAGALAVGSGSRSVLAGSPAERTAREAHFLLVFGSRPAIREALLADLGAGSPPG